MGYTPAAFAHFTHDRETSAEKLEIFCGLVTMVLGVLAIFQLWLVGDVRRELRRLKALEDEKR
jgi:hypothetical protein